MREYSLDSIRCDSIRRVFACIPQKGRIGRLEISEKTGLSLMTVGKITDMLLFKGVVEYQKSDSGSAGRKAKHISLSDKKYMLVLTVSMAAVEACFVSSKLEKRDSFRFEFFGDTEATDDFIGELMSSVFKNGLVGSIAGVGASYDTEEDRALAQRLVSVCTDTLSVDVSYVGHSLLSKARAAGKGARILYFVKDAGGARGVLYGEHSEEGRISESDDYKLGEKISGLKEFFAPDALFCEFLTNDSTNVTSKQARELALTGTADIVREKYLLL